MPSEADVKLEIGHVLFMDIIGYSKLLIDDQRELQQQLNQIVRNSETFRAAEASGKLVRLPTGDGMALVFFTTPEAPMQCALEISEALQGKSRLKVRMGINTGPVSGVADVNDKSNVAGGGINMAQRVMDCGDAGHILLSRRASEDLAQYRRWETHLHDLGEFEVKHAVRIPIVNFYTDKLGNPEIPGKLKQFSRKRAVNRLVRRALATALLLAFVALIVLFFRRPPSTPGDSSVPSIAEKSIAVLPFENLSANQENAFFTDGVQGEILTNLAKVADLKVISQTSVMQYKNTAKRNLREIARGLGVAHILEGSVQRAANRVRVNAQLIDARNDAHMWAETYDRELADVFGIQSEIARKIANELQAKLSPREEEMMLAKPTNDMVAYDLYLRAVEIWRNRSSSSGSGGREKVEESIRLLDQAVGRDSNFVPALCALARAHLYLHWQVADPIAGHLELGRKALDAAARLQPDSGDVHWTRGLYYYHGSRDYAPALAEFALAKRSSPNDPNIPFSIAIVERRQDHWEESTRHIEEALQVDPHNVQFISELAGTNYFILRRYDKAVKIIDNALAWKPGDFGLAFLAAYIEMAWKADLRRWKEVVSGNWARNADPDELINARLSLALKERDYHAAEEILASPGGNEYDDDGFFTPREWNQAIVARGLGDHIKAHAAFEAALVRAATAVRERPDDAKALMVLGELDAALGNKEDAINEGQRASELLPVEKDALNGNQLLVKLTGIYTQVGETDRALDLLEKVIHKPDGSNYGSLKLDQVWDPLRGNPRFEKVVADLAPKN
jgi:TolB-like protein/Flp pilus assembly protein TadD